MRIRARSKATGAPMRVLMITRLRISGSDHVGLTPGEALQEFLLDHHMTRIDLAARLGLQVERVSARVAGKVRIPRVCPTIVNDWVSW